MLGPTDVTDWAPSSREQLAAHLRQHPVLRHCLRHPDDPDALQLRTLSPLLARFLRHDLLSFDELQQVQNMVTAG